MVSTKIEAVREFVQEKLTSNPAPDVDQGCAGAQGSRVAVDVANSLSVVSCCRDGNSTTVDRGQNDENLGSFRMNLDGEELGDLAKHET